MNKEIPQLSVIVLCYGAGEYARIFCAHMIRALEKSNISYELVLVGNIVLHKDEFTHAVITDIAKLNTNIRTVTKKITSGGMGHDMRSGLEAATGNTLAVIDGDGQMPPEDIIRVYEKLTHDNLDICKTKRITRHDGLPRKFISLVFNVYMHVMFPGINGADINGKPKIFTRNAYEKMRLESNDWFIDAEIMIKARRYKFKVGDVPTEFYANSERPSFISFAAIFEFLKNITLYRIREFRYRQQK